MSTLPILYGIAVLFSGLPVLLAAEGPGIPNIAYSPTRTGEILSTIDTGKAISGTALHRGYLFIPLGVDHGGGVGAGAFAFYDVSNPSLPTKFFDSRDYQNRYHNSATLDYVGDWAELHHLPTSGSLMLMSERRTVSAGFSIFDLAPLYDADPNTFPKTISRYSFPGVTGASNYDGYSFALAWQGQRYVYAPTGSEGLFIVDTSNLSSPVLHAHRTRAQLGGLTLRQAIPIGNILILTTAAVESTFNAIIMNISDPQNPVQIGSFSGPLGYQGFVYGSSFYGGGMTLARHDFTNPANIVTTTLQTTTNFDRPEYGYGKDGHLFIGHYPGATKWKLNGNTADFVSRVDSGLIDDHAFLNPLGNLIALCTDHNNPRKLMIGIHGPEKDLEPPAALYVSPTNGATGAHTLSRVGISFSDTVDPTSVNTSTMIVRKFGTSVAIPGTYSSMVGIVNFVPNVALEADTTYEVVLAAGGVKDQSGNGIAAETLVSRFATGNVLADYRVTINPTPPTLLGVPANFSATVQSGSSSLEHAWSFEDGTAMTAFSSSTSRSHTFATAGNYNITLRTRIVGRTGYSEVTTTQVIHHPISGTPPVNSTTIAADPAQSLVWNVNPDNNSVSAINTLTFQRTYEITVGQNPRSLAFGPTNTLWVVNKKSATLTKINRANGAVLATYALPLGSDPHAIVIHSGMAYVSLEATGQVAKIDTATGGVTATLSVGSWPRALAIDPGAQRLWVARFISPDGAGILTPINLTNFTGLSPTALAVVTSADSLTNGRGLPNYLGALAISPDLTQLYVPSKKDNIARGIKRDGLPLTFEHTVRSMAANVSLPSGVENSARRIDFDNSDFASAVAFSPLGNLAFFTTSGSTTIWAVDAYRPASFYTFISGGQAPDGLTFNASGDRLFIHNFMDRSITIFNTASSGTTPQIAKVATVSTEVLTSQILLGKQLFYSTLSTKLAQEGYMSCSSCHLDGGHDGRTWDFSNLGEGFRNTIDLTGKGSTHGPSHWTANFDEIQDFEGQIRTLSSGTGLMTNADFSVGNRDQPLGQPKAGISSDLDALAAYVNSLQTSGRSPHRAANGSLTSSATAGRLIFEAENCSSCHGGNSFADSVSLQRHNVGTLKTTSGSRLGQTLDGLDSPTLRGLWKSAPYLHDGSAPTLRAVLKERDLAGLHGHLFHRADAELDQLVAYLLSIDDLETTAPTGTSPAAPVLTTPSTQLSTQFVALSLNLQATSSSPLLWHALSLPPGLLIDAKTGRINGAPTVVGDFTARISVRVVGGRSSETSFAWKVKAHPIDPNLQRYVKFVSDSSLAGDSFTAVEDFQIFGAQGGLINRSQWIATASSEELVGDNNGAARAIDDVAGTIWHNEWLDGPNAAHPHELVIDLGSNQKITAFRYLPRQGGSNGRIANWRFYWSQDRATWTLAGQGTFPNSAAAQIVGLSHLGTGITREVWTGIDGSTVASLTSDPRYPNQPTSSNVLTSFTTPLNVGDSFGTRVHGYLVPPVSGDYTFWIASDDDGQLLLSPDHQPTGSTQIASVIGFTGPTEWTKFSSQQSTPVSLTAGVRYYISALQKDNVGSDHVAVAWSGPSIAQAIIPRDHLTPYHVIGLDPNPPPIFAGVTTFNVQENSVVGTSIATISATDPGQSISYQITNGNSSGAFSIDPTTGVLRVAGNIDYETSPIYQLQLLATDNGSPIASSARHITVTVGNVLEKNSEVVLLKLAGSYPGQGNPAVIGFDADPDNDGSSNAIEVLLGTNPTTADAPPQMKFAKVALNGKTYLEYEFTVASTVNPDAGFQCLGGTLSGNWTPLANTPQLVSDSAGVRTYRVRDDFALQDASRRFMRISVKSDDAAN